MIGVRSEHDGRVDVLQIEGTKLFDFFQDLGEALEIFLDPLWIQRDAEDIANEVVVSHLPVLSILSLAFGPLALSRDRVLVLSNAQILAHTCRRSCCADSSLVDDLT